MACQSQITGDGKKNDQSNFLGIFRIFDSDMLYMCNLWIDTLNHKNKNKLLFTIVYTNVGSLGPRIPTETLGHPGRAHSNEQKCRTQKRKFSRAKAVHNIS